MYNCTCRYGVEHIMSQDSKWIKKEIAKVLIKEGLIDEAFGQGGRHSDLWNTFVAPFTDIVKAAALSGQDILSAVKLNLDLLLAIDPDTVKKAHENMTREKRQWMQNGSPSWMQMQPPAVEILNFLLLL